METKFKVGCTYLASGFSKCGSIIKARILKRTEHTVYVECDVLFGDKVVRRIKLDADDDEYVVLGSGFNLSAVDIDSDSRTMNEAIEIQNAIMEDDVWTPSRYEGIQNLVIEETDDGVRFVNTTRYQPAQMDFTVEEWTLDQPVDTITMKVVDMVWEDPACDYPKELVVYLPKDCINAENEGVEVMHAVFEALKNKGYFHHFDEMEYLGLSGYDLQECPMCYDFDYRDEIGLGGS